MYVGSTLCCSFIKLNLQMKRVSLELVIGLFPLVLLFKPSQEQSIQGFAEKAGVEYLCECYFHNSIATFHWE